MPRRDPYVPSAGIAKWIGALLISMSWRTFSSGIPSLSASSSGVGSANGMDRLLSQLG